MLKSKIFGIAIIAVIASVSVGVFTYYSTTQTSNYNEQEPATETTNLFPKPTPPKLAVYGAPTTALDAETAVGYKIKLPSRVPENISVKLIKVRAEEKLVHVFLSPSNLEDSMTLDDVMAAKGILISYQLWDATITPEEWMNAWMEQGSGNFVTVHGTRAVGNDRDPLTGAWSHLFWFDNGIQYTITADRPLAELLQIAESIPLLQQ